MMWLNTGLSWKITKKYNLVLASRPKQVGRRSIPYNRCFVFIAISLNLQNEDKAHTSSFISFFKSRFLPFFCDSELIITYGLNLSDVKLPISSLRVLPTLRKWFRGYFCLDASLNLLPCYYWWRVLGSFKNFGNIPKDYFFTLQFLWT